MNHIWVQRRGGTEEDATFESRKRLSRVFNQKHSRDDSPLREAHDSIKWTIGLNKLDHVEHKLLDVADSDFFFEVSIEFIGYSGNSC